MSITTPKSSEQITNTSIEQMHDQTRTIVNGLDATNVGRSSLNIAQLGTATLVQNSGISAVAGNTYITSAVSRWVTGGGSTRGLEYVTLSGLLSEVTSWQTLMSMSSSGVTYKNNSPMIINFNCRVAEFLNASNTEIVTEIPFMIWFGILIERTNAAGSADNVVIEESVVGVHLQESIKYITDTASTPTEVDRIGGIEQAVAYTAMHTIDSSFTYGNVIIKAAICPCSAAYAQPSPPASPTNQKINIKNAFSSFIVLEPGS
jgi:hypothetical protein